MEVVTNQPNSKLGLTMMLMVVVIIVTFVAATMALIIATTIGHPLLNAKIKKMREKKEGPLYDKNKTFFFLVMHYLLAFTTIIVYTYTPQMTMVCNQHISMATLGSI
jgi:hypothetical protein